VTVLSPPHENELIDALYTLDAARRGALELRYSHGLQPAEIAELLGLSPAAIGDLLERAVEGLILELELDSLDGGVAMILRLTGLPRDAWGDRSPAETVALARDALSGGGGVQRLADRHLDRQ
jgi:hypothetical protein